MAKTIRSEVLKTIQKRMARRTRDGSCKWSARETAELCAAYLQWFKSEEK